MTTCNSCSCYKGLRFGIQMAFQSIVDITKRTVYAQEALVCMSARVT